MDPASEQIHYTKRQRERIYNDEVYFLAGSPPDNVPEWANKGKTDYYETETDFDTSFIDMDEEMDFIADDAFKQTEFYDEYFDEVGESSTAAVQVSRMFFLILFYI